MASNCRCHQGTVGRRFAFYALRPATRFLWLMDDFFPFAISDRGCHHYFPHFWRGAVESVVYFAQLPKVPSFFSDDLIAQDTGDIYLLSGSAFKRLSLFVSACLGGCSKSQLPLGEQDHRTWVLDALRRSTKGLSKPGVAIFCGRSSVRFGCEDASRGRSRAS